MKKIIMYKGKGTALVDDDVFGEVSKHSWWMNDRGYAVGYVNNKHIKMHNFILGKKKGCEIDHVNRNKLDNRKENLRHVTHSENIRNAKIQSNNKSGHKGVHWCKEIKKWQALLGISGKKLNLGYFASKEDAIKAREKAENKYFR